MQASLPGFLIASFVAVLPLSNLSANDTRSTGPVTLTTEEDHQQMLRQLGITRLRPGPSGNPGAPNSANYEEAKANPYPQWPEILKLEDGTPVTTAKAWWMQRRPEIVELFQQEVYGRVPKRTPAITWSVREQREGSAGDVPITVQHIVGTVDNTACPEIEVEISMSLTLPKKTAGPVPVLMMFGRTEFDPMPEWMRRFSDRRPESAGGPRRPSRTDELITAGWGCVMINPGSIQADNGAGLTRGVIGLTNLGQPRKPDDWGSLRAWAWGASRGLDYLQSDPRVDAKRVGIEGVSRYGKAALVTMAFDQRFAMALVGSSGAGGATPHRRNFGEAVENLTGSGEYHWMAGNFLKYGAEEASFGSNSASDIPVDSHQLIALCAPRLTFISYGIPEKGDANWLDQRGSFMAAVAAGKVFRLLGSQGLGTTDDYVNEPLPPVGEGLLKGTLAWRQHDGGHTDAPNIKHFIAWAKQHFEAQEPGTAARNPIIWADIPDLAVIRVDNTYYMSSTTMHLSPGLPIMKSKDLVHWQLVGYAYDTLADNDALTLQHGSSAYGAGSWASSLRYHDGTFYVSTFASTTGKTHVFKTKDIENGPWTESSFSPALHDSSLHFEDDGRVYMVHGSGNLRLTELAADASAIKPGGVDQVIVSNASLVAGPNVGLRAEGSQLRKIDGKYYLCLITWPKGGIRTQLVFRADNLTGPYEGRVVLKHEGVAQGGLIDTPDGDWYALLFQDHGAVGRVPFLVPVKWEDGWPVLGVDGRVPKTLDIPADDEGLSNIVASDEFDRKPGQPTLPLAWQWNHNPDNDHWSLAKRPGWLRLTTGRIDAGLLTARNTLTQRTFGPECSGTVAIDVGNMNDGDFAGLAAFQKKYGFVAVKMVGNNKSIVAVSAGTESPEEVESVPLNQQVVFLKVDCDYKNRADKARFYYSLDGEKWTTIGKPLQMVYTLPHFMGYRFGLFNFATKTPGGFADFDYFRLSDKLTDTN